jgi:hypothetical protein
MATVNLGSIKFKWKGTYSGATAYTVDDVVSYNGSSYICILASTGNLPTNATYFEQMSSAGTNGTNGTDLTTTLTTQGDLVYRDGSGLQRLGAGTAGQVLQTGGAGANPSWGTVSSPIAQMIVNSNNTQTDNSSNTTYVSGGMPTLTITPTSASNDIYVEWFVHTKMDPTVSADVGIKFEIYRDGTLLHTTPSNGRAYNYNNGASDSRRQVVQVAWLDASHSTTSQVVYSLKFKNPQNTNTVTVNGNNEYSWGKAIELT